MASIKDPIHGFIDVPPLVEQLIDTPEMQRLRRVKQLGLADLVYPGANHTRFEHSLGTYHLARELCRTLEIESRFVEVAALLHDLGHGPLSHVTEEVITEFGAPSHEDAAAEIVETGEVSVVLEEWGIDPVEVGDLFAGRGVYGEVISSELDVDRMDYLARDAHYTGAHYGVTDYERLLHQLNLVGDELVVSGGGFEAAESLLVSRFLMQPTVYRHHVSRIGKAMVKAALTEALEKGQLSPEEVRRMDDCEFFGTLGGLGGFPAEIVSRVRERRLYKRALWEPFPGGRGEWRTEIHSGSKGFRAEVAREAGVEESRVLIDAPPPREMEELSMRAEVSGEVKPIGEVSRLVAMLKEAQWEDWTLGVYCPEVNLDEVGGAARRVLGSR